MEGFVTAIAVILVLCGVAEWLWRHKAFALFLLAYGLLYWLSR